MQGELTAVGFFMMRTPALPWDTLQRLCPGMAAGEIAGADARPQRALLRAHLREIAACADVRDALRVASAGFAARMTDWLDGSESADALGVERIVLRYLQRMATRATPFGLFAGWAVGPIGESTRLAVPPLAEHIRHIRLDAGYLQSLAGQLARDTGIRRLLRYRAAQTIYEAGGRQRYYEARTDGVDRTYHLVEVLPSPYLSAVLEAANAGDGATMQELCAVLLAKFDDIDEPAALDYVEMLVDASLLCPLLSPLATGAEPAVAMLEALRGVAAGHPVTAGLAAVLTALPQVGGARSRSNPEREAELETALRALPGGDGVSHLFHVDLEKPTASLVLSQRMADEIAAGAALLRTLAPPAGTSALEDFAHRFEARYGSREVALLQTLDEEDGIGFDARSYVGASPSPLLEGLPPPEPAAPLAWGRREQILLQRLADALHRQATQIELSAADLMALAGGRPEAAPDVIPNGLAAMVSIAAANEQAMAQGRYSIYLQKVVGGSAGTLLGRFCHASPVLAAHVRDALRQEEACDPDAIHAEIAYLPQGRAANVVCRPVLRAYEIPLDEASGASRSRQIPLSDLLVSVRGSKVQLRSAALGLRVVPHLSCAHAYWRGGPVLYRFLASVGLGGQASEHAFSWGPLAGAPFLPRVTSGRFVLALAQWRLESGELMVAGKGAMQAVREARQLPRLVWFVEDDNTLLVDLDNALSVDTFLAAIRRRTAITLREVFPPPDQLLATGEEGRFHHELVVPLVRTSHAWSRHRSAVAPRFSTPEGRHDSRPGDDWFYLKLYAGPATLDRVLAEILAPLIAALRAAGAIDGWFFVRYADPDWHLRLRLHGNHDVLWQRVAPQVFKALDPCRDSLRRQVVDTYEPEVERYGGREAMEIAHRLFEADSDAAMAIVSGFRADNEARWRLAMLGMDALLADFDLGVSERRRVMAACRSLLMENQPDQRGQRVQRDQRKTMQALARKYRALRAEVAHLLSAPPDRFGAAGRAIRARSAAIASVPARLAALEAGGQLGCSRMALIQSYLHMWANRMFRDCANDYELVLYDLLERHYTSEAARQQRGSKPMAAPKALGAHECLPVR